MRLCWPEEKEYKKGPGPTEQQQAWLLEQLDVELQKPLQNWHQFDAALAWYSGKRFYTGKAQVYGTTAEGQIVV